MAQFARKIAKSVSVNNFWWFNNYTAGRKNNFFSPDGRLAPKFLKVVVNYKKFGRHFQRQKRPFFFTLSAF